jgi:hypothetical protein
MAGAPSTLMPAGEFLPQRNPLLCGSRQALDIV